MYVRLRILLVMSMRLSVLAIAELPAQQLSNYTHSTFSYSSLSLVRVEPLSSIIGLLRALLGYLTLALRLLRLPEQGQPRWEAI